MGSQVKLNELTPDEEAAAEGKPKSSRQSRSRRPSKSESDLRERLQGCFERIAAALEERGDEEMADIVREDGAIMSQGLVSLTRPFVALRTPLLAAVAIVEPVLAFGRIVRVMVLRGADRRARIAEERAAEAEVQHEQQ